MLKQEGLVGALVNYDGQHNDTRMNLALVMPAVQQGATVANYVEVMNITSAYFGDRETDYSPWFHPRYSLRVINMQRVINAPGPFSDTLLTMDNPSRQPNVHTSSGMHIVLSKYHSAQTMGYLTPPLRMAGSTVTGINAWPSDIEENRAANQDDIRWVLEEIRRYLSPSRSAVAMFQCVVGFTAAYLPRRDGLLTIAGGKWTTYRAVAKETVDIDETVKVFALKLTSGCVTQRPRLISSDGWSRNVFISLVKGYGDCTWEGT
ncbi:hypothetical protein BC835DRAFT_1421331 [Cytidiella melzeri]|nr:hypothetical protein BC835DRAFT_1421331 [Cytidiella melzeri]